MNTTVEISSKPRQGSVTGQGQRLSTGSKVADAKPPRDRQESFAKSNRESGYHTATAKERNKTVSKSETKAHSRSSKPRVEGLSQENASNKGGVEVSPSDQGQGSEQASTTQQVPVIGRKRKAPEVVALSISAKKKEISKVITSKDAKLGQTMLRKVETKEFHPEPTQDQARDGEVSITNEDKEHLQPAPAGEDSQARPRASSQQNETVVRPEEGLPIGGQG